MRERDLRLCYTEHIGVREYKGTHISRSLFSLEDTVYKYLPNGFQCIFVFDVDRFQMNSPSSNIRRIKGISDHVLFTLLARIP